MAPRPRPADSDCTAGTDTSRPRRALLQLSDGRRHVVDRRLSGGPLWRDRFLHDALRTTLAAGGRRACGVVLAARTREGDPHAMGPELHRGVRSLRVNARALDRGVRDLPSRAREAATDPGVGTTRGSL